jgi:hypothetical protein
MPHCGTRVQASPHIPTEWHSPQTTFLHTLYAAMLHYSSFCPLYSKWFEVVNTIRKQHDLVAVKPVGEDEYHEQSAKETYPLPLFGLFPGQSASVIEKYCDEIEAVVSEWKLAQENHSHVKRTCEIEYGETDGGESKLQSGP